MNSEEVRSEYGRDKLLRTEINSEDGKINIKNNKKG